MLNKKDERVGKRHPLSPFASLFRSGKEETRAQCELQKARKAYARERSRQREHLEEELAGVDRLFEDGSISEDVHTRYRKMLEMGYAQKRQETREKFGFT